MNANSDDGNRGTRGNRAVRIASGVIVGLIALVLVIYLADLAFNRGNVPRGTTVGGVEIGGTAPDEAVSTLEGELGDVARRPVTVEAASESTQFVPDASGLGIDWPGTVADAGEESANPITRFMGIFRTHEVDVVPTINEAALTPELERIAGELRREPVDGSLTIEGGKTQVNEPVEGQKVEAEDLYNRVTTGWLDPKGITVDAQPVAPVIDKKALSSAVDGPVKNALNGSLTLRGKDAVAGVIEQDRIGDIVQFSSKDGQITPEINRDRAQEIFSERLSETETEMKNARTIPGGGVEPSVDGTVVDWEASMEGFEQRLLGGGERTWDAQYTNRPADFTTEQARAATFDEVVGSFTTGGFSAASGTNIEIVARAVDGAIINPGETFSLNGFTGPRGTAQGYVASGIIENGRPGKAVGGGISQFATTLYNASYFAGMTDVESTPHSYYISRYPMGREATVYEGAIDLKFRNDSPYPVRISTSVGGGDVTVSLMGKKTVQVDSSNGGRWATTSPQPVTVSGDDCSPSSGSEGFTTSDTRVVTDLAGTEISRNTSTTVYDPQPIVRCE